MDLIQALPEEQKRRPLIVSVGQTSIDTVRLDGKPPSVHVGGSAYIPAQIWADYGVPVGLVSCLGAELTANELRTENLDLRGVATLSGPSTSVELDYSSQKLIGLRINAGV